MRILAVTNLYPTHQAPASGTFVEQQIQGLRRCGLDVEVMHLRRFTQGKCVYRGLSKALRQRLEAGPPHLVHTMYGGVLAEVVTRVVTDRPVVVSFCGTDLLGGAFFGFFRKFSVRYGILASHLAARRAAAIVVKSRNLQAALPRGLDASKVWRIPNGVDLKRFEPLDRRVCRHRLGWEEGVFHVLFPNRADHPRKRFALAREAVARLDRLGVRAGLHELHGVPHQDVPLWLNASDVLILTSFHEGSPNIVKEALACNRPVVSVDVGDVRERLEGIDGCYLAEPDADDLADKLQRVAHGPRQVEGRIKMQDLSLERVAQRLIEVYTTVCNPVTPA